LTAARRRATGEPLMTALRSALSNVGIEQPVRTVRRKHHTYVSSHLSLNLDCTLEDGSRLHLLCKHGPSHDRNRWGLRRGLTYEATVYRSVLQGRLESPRFYGSYESSGLTWLFIEYLGEGWRLPEAPYTGIVDAAALIGTLHRRTAEIACSDSASILNHYDRGYFRTCVREASAMAERWSRRVPGFRELVERFEEAAELLISAPRTVVHGEFTPKNVVWADERPHPVDWEEAAVGAGEIDIACLTDEWDEELVELSIAAYLRNRWPDGPPHEFSRTLRAARVYWLMRWLGDSEDADEEEDTEWVVGRLNELA
jgi:hypothetical protein